MTVGELIEILRVYDPDIEAVRYDYDWCDYLPLNEVYLNDGFVILA